MNISKVIGTVEVQMSDHSGRIKVISFRSNDNYITTPSEIEKAFPPEGYVFAPKFFERFTHPLHSLVEFSITTSNQIKKGDTVLMDVSKECKLGYPIIDATVHIFKSEFSIDQPILKSFIKEEVIPFYIKAKGFLYGPFKLANGEVIPKVGKEVNKYATETVVSFKSGGRHYIVNEPANVIGKVDCMTLAQLGDWFKQQLKNYSLTFDINSLKKAFESQENETLDKSRLERSLSQLDQLKLNKDHLNKMSELSGKYQTAYQESIILCKEELKSDFVSAFLNQQEVIRDELEILQQKIERCVEKEKHLIDNVEKLKNEVEWLEQNKVRLIKDLEVHAQIKTMSTNSSSSQMYTYEEQTFSKLNQSYKTLDEYKSAFDSTVIGLDQAASKISYNIIYQLKDYKCLLVDNITVIMQLAKLSNNCKVFFQQVEPDWLKFEDLFENGLKQASESANLNKEVIHFFILEDINMASIECYGKPIIDIANGVRKKIAGLNSIWPENLWLFGVPIDLDLNDNFGLPLYKKTFANWGCIPKSFSLSFNDTDSDRFLELMSLRKHSNIVSTSHDEYFPA